MAMPKIGRNDPCPCGSGKKYKHCCLKKARARDMEHNAQMEGLTHACTWVQIKSPARMHKLRKMFFGHFDPLMQKVFSSREDLLYALTICFYEWLVADQVMEIGNDDYENVSTCVLGDNGPFLTDVGRKYIRDLAGTSLSLYDILEVYPDSVLIKELDVLRPDAVPIKARLTPPFPFVQGDVMGLRILDKDGDPYLARGVFPFTRQDAKAVIKDILHYRHRCETENLEVPPSITMDIPIVQFWMCSFALQSVPQKNDPFTHDPLDVAQDTFRVSDWPSLEACLNAYADFIKVEPQKFMGKEEGIKDEWLWTVAMQSKDKRAIRGRLMRKAEKVPQGSETDLRRSETDVFATQSFSPTSGDLLRSVLDKIAGSYLTFTQRETQNELESMVAALRMATDIDEPYDPQKPDVPHEKLQQARHAMRYSQYMHWLETPLQELGGLCPRDAVSRPDLRDTLLALVRAVCKLEQEKAKQEGCEEPDMDFLWEALRLEEEEEVETPLAAAVDSAATPPAQPVAAETQTLSPSSPSGTIATSTP